MNFRISDITIGDNNKVFIIAELSANHNGNIDTAIKTIEAVKRAGADAIKLQTFTPETITIKSNKPDFKITQGTIWDGSFLYDLYLQAYTPWEWHEQLFKKAKELGLVCFSSPFDRSAVDFLETFNVPAYKIASLEITDIPLIEYVAKKQKPIIISTGIAKIEDIEFAIKTCHLQGNFQIALLKCTTSYPAPIEESNLCMIKDFEKKFNTITGLSDHTLGIVAPIVATSLGAKIIEKHFIIDRSIGGPDATFSLNEEEFTDMVKNIRTTELAIGQINYDLSPNQIKSRDFARSLYISENCKSGDIITERNIKSIRPGFGLHPKHFSTILGKRFNKDVEKGDRLDWSLID